MGLDSLVLPDVMLVLDGTGVIRDATLSNQLAGEEVAGWIGSPWVDTVRESDGAGLRQMIDTALAAGVGAFRNVTQHFPSGLELPVEYTSVRLGDEPGLLAIGKNLRAELELETRLVEAQQAMERDYWKLRELETRYRLLFESSRDAVLLLRASTLGIVELNPTAAQALGITAHPGRVHPEVRFPELLLADERDVFAGMVRRIRELGRAPGVRLRLGKGRLSWLVRASLMTSAQEEVLLVQLVSSAVDHPAGEPADPIGFEDLIEAGPDGFVVIDPGGRVLRANRAFLDLAQLGSETAVLGEPLDRWLGRPGVDLAVLLANVSRLGAVRLFTSVLHGERGGVVEAELSAAGRGGRQGRTIGVFIRDVGKRPHGGESARGLDGLMESLTKQIGKTSLRKLVDETIAVVEQRYIEAALTLTGGNRTAAAEVLGLSRQSLYVKLSRYALEEDARLLAEEH